MKETDWEKRKGIDHVLSNNYSGVLYFITQWHYERLKISLGPVFRLFWEMYDQGSKLSGKINSRLTSLAMCGIKGL